MVDLTPKNPDQHHSHDSKKLTVKGSDFVTENTGFIKDYYKISSCIGRGKSQGCLPFAKVSNTRNCRRVRRSAKVFAQRDESAAGSEDNKQKVLGGRRER